MGVSQSRSPATHGALLEVFGRLFDPGDVPALRVAEGVEASAAAVKDPEWLELVALALDDTELGRGQDIDVASENLIAIL